MIRARKTASVLPSRVYERLGDRRWRIWYKPPTGPSVTLLECRSNDMTKGEARHRARVRYQELYGGLPEVAPEVVTFAALAERWLLWQEGLPEGDEQKYTDATMATERIRLRTLLKVFAKVPVASIEPSHWYQFQDRRREKGFGAAANKEIALASTILEYGRRRGLVTINTARGIKRVKTRPRQRAVTLAEVDAVLELARKLGGSAHIQALAAKAAFLCLRRPSEILALEKADVTADGIVFLAVKRKAGEAERRALIEWSPTLKATIEEAKTIKRRGIAPAPLLFGNLSGERYSKSGWGVLWRRLMVRAAKEIPGFEPFTLQDNRAGGVTRKEHRGDSDTQNVTLHKTRRMIDTTYDRRRQRTGKPAE